MNKTSEIAELIQAIKEESLDIIIFQKTSFGEKPFESGVWKFWHKDKEDIHLHIEVQNGMLWALYASKEFENKYPIEAVKICNFLNGKQEQVKAK